MPLALDMPPTATGQDRGAVFQHGFQTEYTARREQPYEGANISYQYVPNHIPEYAHQRFFEAATRKIEKLIPLFNSRIQEASDAGTIPPVPEEFAKIFNNTLAVFALNPKFSALSFSVTEDGEFELARVNEDRRDVDYFTLGFDTDSRTVMAAFSSISSGISHFNTFGTLQDVAQQIVDSEIL